MTTSLLRVGMVGAGRSRNGLGPFLARHLRAAGAHVVAISGRDLRRTEDTALAMERELGLRPRVCTDPAELCALPLDALVVAAPALAHAAALRAGLAAGLPTLCEKPLGPAAQSAEVLALVDGFAAARKPLWEHCQWPETLPVWHRLHPAVSVDPLEELAMRLSPAEAGPAMLEDSLSHLLSLAQALLPATAELSWQELGFEGDAGEAGGLQLRGRLGGSGVATRLCLDLQVCRQQPRPAWYALNGARITRRIDTSAGYAIGFAAGGRWESADDPSARLVYRFVAHLREADLERNATESQRIHQRQRLYAEAIAALGQFLGGKD